MPTLMVCRHTGNPLRIKPKPLFNWSELSGRASKSIDFMLMFFVSLLLQVTKSCSQIPKISCERCVGGHFKDWKGQDEGWSMLYNCTFFCFPTCAFIVNNNYIWTCICYNIFLPKMHNHCKCMCYNTTQQKKTSILTQKKLDKIKNTKTSALCTHGSGSLVVLSFDVFPTILFLWSENEKHLKQPQNHPVT